MEIIFQEISLYDTGFYFYKLCPFSIKTVVQVEVFQIHTIFKCSNYQVRFWFPLLDAAIDSLQAPEP